MGWLRVDDGFTEHHKLIELGNPTARWTWLEILTYCARRGNDGQVPASIGEVVKRATPAFIDRCVQVGLLDESPAGLRVHDWAHYNPKDPTKAERQARWRAKKTPPVDGRVDAAVDENGVYPNVYETRPPAPTPTPEEQLGVKDVNAVVPRPGPLERLLEVLHDKDEGTKNVLLAMHREFKLSEGDFEWARECATGPGVDSPTKVAVSELKKRVLSRA